MVVVFYRTGGSMKSINMPASISCWTVRNPLVVNNIVR